MSEEIDVIVIERTQQKLGKFIKKPQLSEKLLKRPPFRFLHDIVSAASKQYGILDEVFTKEELTYDNIKDKENKIAFLQKLIQYLSNELDEKLLAKPTKIVAGSEPERTNELLQALATLLEKKQKTSKKSPISTTEKNNANNAKTNVKKPSTVKTEDVKKTAEPSSKTSKPVTNKTSKQSKIGKDELDPVNKPTATDKNLSKTKEASKTDNSNVTSAKPVATKVSKGPKPGKDAEIVAAGRTKLVDKETARPDATEKNSAKTKEASKIGNPEVKSVKNVSNKITTVGKKESAKPTPTDKTVETKESAKTGTSGVDDSSSKVTSQSPAKSVERKVEKDAETVSQSAAKEPTLTDRKSSSVKKSERNTAGKRENIISSTPSVLPDSVDITGDRDKPVDADPVSTEKPATPIEESRSSKSASSELENGTMKTMEQPGKEVSKLSPPVSAIKDGFEKPIAIPSASPSQSPLPNRPVSGNGFLPTRPNSSRRPPSRTVKNSLTVIHQDNRTFGGHVPRVIVEGHPLSDDEDDKIVEAAVFDPIVDDLSLTGNDDISAENEQGKLVEQIRSAQKKLDPSTELDLDNKENIGATNKLENLKGFIQEMAQCAIPLSHLIPVVHEDMDTMFQEWQFWKREADSLEEQYNREATRAGEPQLAKIQTELEGLEKAIQEQRMKLDVAKASVLRCENHVSLVISNFAQNQ